MSILCPRDNFGKKKLFVMVNTHGACGVEQGGGGAFVVITDEWHDRLEPSESRLAVSPRRHCTVRVDALAMQTVSTQGVEEHGVTLGGDMLGGDSAGRPMVEHTMQQRLDGSVTSNGDSSASYNAAVTTQGNVGNSLGGDGSLGGDSRVSNDSAGQPAIAEPMLRQLDGRAAQCDIIGGESLIVYRT